MTTGRPLLALLVPMGIAATMACQQSPSGAPAGVTSPGAYNCCPNLSQSTLSGNTPDETGFSKTPIAEVNAASSGAPPMMASAPVPVSGGNAAGGAAAAANRINGTVQSISATTLLLATGESYNVTPDTRIVLSRPGTPANLTNGQYVAITATKAADGSLLASIVSVFPEAQRGVGEGQRPLTGDNLMTNATVEEAQISGVQGAALSVDYLGTTQQVTVPATAQIIVRTGGTITDVQPGASVVVAATDSGDAASITVG